MTTVRPLHRRGFKPRRVEGLLRWAVLVLLAGSTPARGEGPVHWRHAGAMPPGAIGRQRLLRGGPLSGYCQPASIRAPEGARIAPAGNGGFQNDHASPLMVGLAIGPVYRFRVTDIPEHPGVEVFPTIEMIDRTYPPPGLSHKYPVPVDLTLDELLMAAEGKFITRVIYLEDPKLALPIAEKAGAPSRWLEVRAGEDPLVTADGLGRPIAILRIGGRVPDSTGNDGMAAGPEPLVIEHEPLPAAEDGVIMPAPAEAPYQPQRLLEVSPPVNLEPGDGVIHAH